jgi:hypothetical protein
MNRSLIILIFISIITSFGQVLAEQAPDVKETATQATLDDHNSAQTEYFTWEQFNNVVLESTDIQKSYQTKWKFELAENSDLKISVDERSGQESRLGEIMMISGRALLISGLKPKEENELDLLDGPVLMCQLAINLLHYAFPEGPKSVVKNTPFALTEEFRSIIIASPNSTSFFPPPWKVSGSVNPIDGSVAFDLKYSFKPEANNAGNSEIWFKGIWEHAKTPNHFSDSMSLQDWTVSIIDPETEKVASANADDALPRKVISGYRTLGELRKFIAQTTAK